jgi:molybdopterin-guanine dinucleotide biosynthesis protein B
VTGWRWAIVHELRDEEKPPLRDILQRLSRADLVIGYKREPIPKIEVRRSGAARGDPLAPDDPAIIALAADHKVDGDGGRGTERQPSSSSASVPAAATATTGELIAKEAVREGGIEVVSVATPNRMHYEITKACREAPSSRPSPPPA